MKTLHVVIWVILLAASNAWTMDLYSAEQIKKACEGSTKFKEMNANQVSNGVDQDKYGDFREQLGSITATCNVYFSSFYDSYTVHKEFKSELYKMLPACIPDSASREQLVLIFLKYASENSQQLHEPAYTVIHESLSKAFPCSKEMESP